jgi:NAD(P)-dependent dehydrogenase (short-subunit alcohol dehydrogenase family)
MWRRLIDINLNGSFFMAQAVGKAMMAANKPGSIVLVASMSGSIVNYPQEQSCYNASKAGVIQFGKSLAAEWAKYNIRVNCISPGQSLFPCSQFLVLTYNRLYGHCSQQRSRT